MVTQAQRTRKLAKALAVGLHSRLDRLGVHLLPKHYYSPVPDKHWLEAHKETWTGRADLAGVDWDLDAQLAWLEEISGRYYNEVQGLRQYQTIAASGVGLGYGAIEAQVLHCFVRAIRPARIVEVGSGVSTACIVAAAKQNQTHGYPWPEIICVEPFPKPTLIALDGVSIIQTIAQTAPIDIFTRLDHGDLLFIDSSHAVKTGSDVIRLFLDIIPRLKPGVHLHIHDIFLPYLYQPDLLESIFYWQETTLLLALLKNNDHLKVRCCLSALHHDRQSGMQRILPDYLPLQPFREGLSTASEAAGEGHFPASIWLQTA